MQFITQEETLEITQRTDDLNQLDWEMSVISVICAIGCLVITLKLLYDLL